MDEEGAEVRTGVLTSAVRDARNGADFAAQVRARSGRGRPHDLRRRGGAADLPRGDRGRAGRRPTPCSWWTSGAARRSWCSAAAARSPSTSRRRSASCATRERFVRARPAAAAEELEALAADVRATLEARRAGRGPRAPAPSSWPWPARRRWPRRWTSASSPTTPTGSRATCSARHAARPGRAPGGPDARAAPGRAAACTRTARS